MAKEKKEEAQEKQKEENKEESKQEEIKEESPPAGGEEKSKEKPEEKKEEEKPEDQPAAGQPKAEKPVEEKKEKSPAKRDRPLDEKKAEPSGKYKDLIKKIESLSVLELAELVKELEDRFGVSAAAPVAAVPAGGPGAAEDKGEAEAKAIFNIELTAAGDQKINVIKALREINPDLGLKEAKDLVDAVPKIIKEEVKKEEAEEIKKKIKEAGGQVTLK